MTAKIVPFRKPPFDVDAILGRGFRMVDGPSFTVVGWDGEVFRCRTPEGASGSLPVAEFKKGLDAGAILSGFQINTKRGTRIL